MRKFARFLLGAAASIAFVASAYAGPGSDGKCHKFENIRELYAGIPVNTLRFDGDLAKAFAKALVVEYPWLILEVDKLATLALVGTVTDTKGYAFILFDGDGCFYGRSTALIPLTTAIKITQAVTKSI